MSSVRRKLRWSQRAVAVILSAFLLMATIQSAKCYLDVVSNSQVMQTSSLQRFRILSARAENRGVVEHKITPSELEELKRKIGVWEEGRNHNQIVNGHGTGLRAPTEEEWAQIAANANIVEAVYLGSADQPPSRVDYSTSSWFPPIGDQDGENSCLAWAIGYYVKTFQEAKEHGWNLTDARWEGAYPTPEYQDKIISPAFIYHLTNWGVNSWTYYDTVINLVCSIGACSWAKMPWNASDQATWPSESAWREAACYRGASTGYESMSVNTDEGILSLKNWIASENLAVIGVDCTQYSSLTSDDVWTVDNYAGGSNHANTIVGYDDDITYLEDGQLSKGAFKIANSWGVGGWEKVPDGFYWISYKAMSQKVGYVMFYRDRIGYVPTLTSSFRIEHPMRGECNVVIGMGTHDNPNVSKYFNDYVRGGNQAFCPNNIVLDITEFRDVVPTVNNQPFFMKVFDGGTSATGTILYFAIGDTVSSNPPEATINEGYVFADLTLLSRPRASFNYSKAWKDKPIIFNASESSDPDGAIVSYTWDFGDGNITTGTDPIIIHVYVNVGNYIVILNVTDNQGLWNTTTAKITVTYRTDINQDKTVNILDIAIVAQAYGAKYNETDGKFWHDPSCKYCPHTSDANLDGNKEINIIDIATIAKDYGKTV